jgi:uroporphyrinogen-III synthase
MPASATSGVLSGRGILVTRPVLQADTLCTAIEAAGGRALRFPVIEIRPAVDPRVVQMGLTRLGEYNLVIFVSANAVQFTLDAMATKTWPTAVKIAAIGAATARAVTRHELKVDMTPERDFTSEALLDLPALQAVRDQRILILRGAGGRDILRDSLRARGAQVDYLEVYRRDSVTTDPAALLKDWQSGAVDAVLISSGESLQKLLAIIGTLGLELLNATTLVVGNARTQERARSLGVTGSILVADDATDAALLDALCTHYAKETPR